MKIDKEKLENAILEEIKDIKTGVHISSKLAVIDLGTIQVQVIVTKDEDDFLNVVPENNCIIGGF